jgi:hypothetical protein
MSTMRLARHLAGLNVSAIVRCCWTPFSAGGEVLVLVEGQTERLAGDGRARRSAPPGDCGIVVGRIILFFTILFRSTRSSVSNVHPAHARSR